MSYENQYISVVIVAAGMGKRMKHKTNKQYIPIHNKPVLAYTVETFNDCSLIDEIIIVVRKEEIDICQAEIVDKYGFHKVAQISVGGKERQDSVYNGLLSVNPKCDIVLIHDGARPFVEKDILIKVIEETRKYKACVVGVPVKDTIKIIGENEMIINTPDRKTMWAVQTPQCFSYKLLLDAYRHAMEKNSQVTDDSMMVEKLGHGVKIIEGSYSNIKITTSEDLKFAQAILEDRDDKK